MQRLAGLQCCVETVLGDNIRGDLVEFGMWRGGVPILMRAVLLAHGDETRLVWLADSFAGGHAWIPQIGAMIRNCG